MTMNAPAIAATAAAPATKSEIIRRNCGQPTPSQMNAARSLPANTQSDWVPARTSLPASDYVDPARYTEEQQRLFRDWPVPLAPSAMVAAGQHVCRDGYGVPILLTRDKQGVARAFYNSCRHRGSRLTDAQDPAKSSLFVCPYHAWSYDLTGRLVGVPRQETFIDLDKSELGLIPVPIVERGGVIWARLDGNEAGGFEHVAPELVAEMEAIDVSSMHLFAHRRHQVAANWKLVMDTFLEGYHVTRLHATTLGHLFEDAIVRVDRLGSHLRQTSGRLKFTPDIVRDEANIDELRKVVTYVYTLVPNGVLICSPDYVNLLLLLPQGVDSTIVENFMLTDLAPQSDKARDRWQRSLDLTDGLAFPEDFAASTACHSGLKSGAVKDLILGGYEQAIKTYHDILGEKLAG